MKVLREIKGVEDEDGVIYWERVVKEENVLLFQTVVKEPVFTILSCVSIVGEEKLK